MEKIPNGIIVSDVSITQNIPVYRSTSASYVDRVRDRGIHFLTGDMTLTADDPRKLEAFLIKVKCAVEPFQIELGGNRFSSNGISSGIPYVTAEYKKGTTRLTVTGFSGTIESGDLFRLPSQTKVYMVANGASSGGSIDIYPPLREKLNADDKMYFNNVIITARLDDTDQTVSYDEQGSIGSITVGWKEVL